MSKPAPINSYESCRGQSPVGTQLTQKELKELISYDSNSGVFVWIKPNKNAKRVKAGDIAGGLNARGYLKIKINNKRYFAHRLAWLYEKGHFPVNVIDHIDGNPSNNKFNNLRDVPQLENTFNRKKHNKNNKSGVVGVTLIKNSNKCVARIGINRKLINLGTYETLEDASRAYSDAKSILHKFISAVEEPAKLGW